MGSRKQTKNAAPGRWPGGFVILTLIAMFPELCSGTLLSGLASLLEVLIVLILSTWHVLQAPILPKTDLTLCWDLIERLALVINLLTTRRLNGKEVTRSSPVVTSFCQFKPRAHVWGQSADYSGCINGVKASFHAQVNDTERKLLPEFDTMEHGFVPTTSMLPVSIGSILYSLTRYPMHKKYAQELSTPPICPQLSTA